MKSISWSEDLHVSIRNSRKSRDENASKKQETGLQQASRKNPEEKQTYELWL